MRYKRDAAAVFTSPSRPAPNRHARESRFPSLITVHPSQLACTPRRLQRKQERGWTGRGSITGSGGRLGPTAAHSGKVTARPDRQLTLVSTHARTKPTCTDRPAKGLAEDERGKRAANAAQSRRTATHARAHTRKTSGSNQTHPERDGSIAQAPPLACPPSEARASASKPAAPVSVGKRTAAGETPSGAA